MDGDSENLGELNFAVSLGKNISRFMSMNLASWYFLSQFQTWMEFDYDFGKFDLWFICAIAIVWNLLKMPLPTEKTIFKVNL